VPTCPVKDEDGVDIPGQGGREAGEEQVHDPGVDGGPYLTAQDGSGHGLQHRKEGLQDGFTG